MFRDAGQLARDGAVDVLHHGEIRGEEDVEVALVHERGGDADVAALVAGLDYRRVQARDRVGEVVKVGEDEAVRREVLVQHVEELHQRRGDVFRDGEVGGKGEGISELAEESWLRDGSGKGRAGGDFSHSKIPEGYRVEVAVVDLVEFAVLVDQNAALKRFFCLRVVSKTVVWEIIDDFECEEEAGRVHILVPVEYRPVDHLDVLHVLATVWRLPDTGHL